MRNLQRHNRKLFRKRTEQYVDIFWIHNVGMFSKITIDKFTFQTNLGRDYKCYERIILSGIVFLELPKVILELHKRLPPVIKLKYPIKRNESSIQFKITSIRITLIDTLYCNI